jgi:hypothetical protein
MIRPSRLVLGAVLVIGAACGGGRPTAPEPAPNTMSPHVEPLLDGGTCVGGWDVQNGKAC